MNTYYCPICKAEVHKSIYGGVIREIFPCAKCNVMIEVNRVVTHPVVRSINFNELISVGQLLRNLKEKHLDNVPIELENTSDGMIKVILTTG